MGRGHWDGRAWEGLRKTRMRRVEEGGGGMGRGRWEALGRPWQQGRRAGTAFCLGKVR